MSPYSGAILAISGPTACGKTRKAVAAARRINAEIISADSRQVYRGMDLGTGKDLDEYSAGGSPVPYHLIDIRPAGYRYNLREFLMDCHAAERQIRARGRVPLICGGTGMYVENALAGVQMAEIPRDEDLRRRLEPLSHDQLIEMLAAMKHLHNTTDTDTRERTIRGIEIEEYYRLHPEADARRRRNEIAPPPYVLIVLDLDRDERRRRISLRMQKRFEQGMTGEVENLIASGVNPDDLLYYGLEYKYVTNHVLGRISRQEMERQLETAIHQFAKRQMTWLRGMERRGFTIHHLPALMPDDEFAIAAEALLIARNNQ